MIMGAMIEQLRAYCPPLAGRVAGAAEFQAGLRNYNTSMPLPSAYVVPLEGSSDGNQNKGGVGIRQTVQAVYGVIVELDAQTDRRGQNPAMWFDTIHAAMFAALGNWLPVPCLTDGNKGFYLVGWRTLDLDRARLFYQWEYALDILLTDADGWQPESWPLESIEADVFGPHGVPLPGTMPAAVVLIPTGEPPIPPATDGPWPQPATQDATP